MEDKEKKITKTNIKKLYMLNEDDYSHLECDIGTTIYGTPYYLFNLKDIQDIAYNKFGSKEEFEKKLAIKQEKSEKLKKKNQQRKQDKLNIIATRKQKLLNAFKEFNLEYRSDSVLCNNYIEKGDEGGKTLDEIIIIMREMKFLYEKTNYRNNIKKTKYRKSINDEEIIRDLVKKESCEEYLSKTKDINEIPFSLVIKYNLILEK
jgi:hypothetical protein